MNLGFSGRNEPWKSIRILGREPASQKKLPQFSASASSSISLIDPPGATSSTPVNMPSIKTLPFEITSMILGELKEDGAELANFAVISRTWQGAVESTLFRELSVNSEEFPEFEFALTASPARFSYLRKLRYSLIMKKRAAQSSVWTQNIHSLYEIRRLFTLLNERPVGGDDASLQLFLDLKFHSPHWVRSTFKKNQLSKIHFCPSEGQMSVPVLSSPSPISIDIKAWCYSSPDARIMALLLKSVPTLREATFDVSEASSHADATDYGKSLASAASQLNALEVTNLQHLTIHFLSSRCTTMSYSRWHGDPYDRWSSTPDYINHVQSAPFNRALRRISSNLQTLRLLGGFALTPDFFCPGLNGAAPEWNIQDVTIQAHPGSTYRTPRRGKFHQDGWRARRDVGKHNSLATSITRAMVKMPKLNRLVVQLKVRNSERREGYPVIGERFQYDRGQWKRGEKADLRRGLYRCGGLHCCNIAHPCPLHPEWNWEVPALAEQYWSEFRDRVNAELGE
ncbi:hypothetical protein B0T16DRAFT_248436 [Cercophora newfieldiana]|uniref:Uncharacterized protein n=1 Tax=Cercophora newfieldiana TaxID=92897 RepID=A0AA40CJV0_9PEZI|nr:hypothetical protein B0T16DRAFT_248436 [Cercophora newfieldiana]